LVEEGADEELPSAGEAPAKDTATEVGTSGSEVADTLVEGAAVEDTVNMDNSSLLPGWQKLVEPSSGDVYYYNEDTGEISWEPPL
jgi:hypothetical protein